MQNKHITIYTTDTCAYCKVVKKYLTMKNYKYIEINLDKYPERRGEAYEVSGSLTVPVTVVDNKVIVGWNVAKLNKALEAA